MVRLLVACTIVLMCSSTALPEEPQPPTRIDTRLLGNFNLDATSPANETVVREAPRLSARPRNEVTLDVGALKSRGGSVTGIRAIRPDGETTVPLDTATVALRPGEVVAVTRDAPVESIELSDGVIQASPTILYTLDASGQTHELGLVHRVTDLRWTPDDHVYAGQLLVGVMDRENPEASDPLEAVVPVQLIAPALDTLDRTAIEVRRLGVPLESVNVHVEFPDQPYQIRLISQIDPDVPPADMNVVRPRLMLSASPTEIQGFGVEEATVLVSPIDTRLSPGETITVSADNGWLAAQQLKVQDDGTASTRIRSRWLGHGVVRVLAPTVYEVDPVDVRYVFPVGFLVATLLGGMLGAFIYVYMMKRANPEDQRSHLVDWVAGVVIGLGLTTMAYAGMTLPAQIPIPEALVGEVAPFALSFICAAGGTGLVGSILGTGKTAKPAAESE